MFSVQALCSLFARRVYKKVVRYGLSTQKGAIVQRRAFLILGSIVGVSPYLHAETATAQQKAFRQVSSLIEAVQAHMFPEGGILPSARAMHTIRFTEETIFHPAYDRDIRAFVIEGAQELSEREKEKFLSYTPQQKEEALRRYEQTNYGSNWLSRIMTLTMEALFSDPVYGSNINASGWKALHTKGGEPRPETRYIQL